MKRLTTILAAGALAAAAHAQSGYILPGVPDLDQKRMALGNDGSFYCVPTAAANLVGYISNHGVPAVTIPAGPLDWQSQTTFADATGVILQLAAYMGTDPFTGTGGQGGLQGLKTVLDLFAPGKFSVVSNYGELYPGHIAASMKDGALINFCYGRYAPQPGFGFYKRTGGHCVTLNGTYSAYPTPTSPLQWTMRYRDPATDSTLATQSLFANAFTRCQQVNLPTDFGQSIDRYRLIDLSPASTTYRCLDRAYFILPQVALTGGPVSTSIYAQRPFRLDGSAVADTVTIPLPQGHTLKKIALTLNQTAAFVVSEAASPPIVCVSHCDLESGVVTPMLTANNPNCQIAINRFNELIVFADGALRRYSIPPPIPTMPAPPVVLLQQIIPPLEINAIVCDDTRDEIVAFNQSSRHLLRFKNDLLLPAVNELLIGAGPVGTGVASIAIDEAAQKYYLTGSNSSLLLKYRLTAPGGTAMTLEASGAVSCCSHPMALQWTDQGTLMLVNDGLMVELEQNGGGAWVPKVGSLFAGRAAGAAMHFARSRTNFMVGVHDTPDWADIPPDMGEAATISQLPDCEVDVDLSGVVGVGDLFGFLSLWFTNHFLSDWNRNGSVSIQDLFNYLTAWFAGC